MGTTWRERGPAYRWRRFWYAVFLLVVAAVLAVPGALALGQIRDATPGAFWVLLPLAVVVVLVGALLEWRFSRRRLRSDYTASDYRLGASLAVLVWLGWVLLPVGGGFVLALASAVLTGPMVTQFLRACFDRELWPEREWRMSGLSPAERRRVAKDKNWMPTRFRSVDPPKTDSEVHPHE